MIATGKTSNSRDSCLVYDSKGEKDERFLQTCEAVLENKKKTNWLKLALFESYRRMKSIFYPLVQKFIMEDE